MTDLDTIRMDAPNAGIISIGTSLSDLRALLDSASDTGTVSGSGHRIVVARIQGAPVEFRLINGFCDGFNYLSYNSSERTMRGEPCFKLYISWEHDVVRILRVTSNRAAAGTAPARLLCDRWW